MSKRRTSRNVQAREATLSLAEAAALLGVEAQTLLEAIEESGIGQPRAGQEFHLDAAEVERYQRLVAKERSQSKESLAALLEELE